MRVKFRGTETTQNICEKWPIEPFFVLWRKLYLIKLVFVIKVFKNGDDDHDDDDDGDDGGMNRIEIEWGGDTDNKINLSICTHDFSSPISNAFWASADWVSRSFRF